MSKQKLAVITLAAFLIIGVGQACRMSQSGSALSSLASPTPTLTPTPNAFAYYKSGHLIRGFEVEELREQGLRDPIAEVTKSLQEKPELIPFKGILGGTMGFYGDDGIHLLSPNWVLAEFDDGHISGRGVFEFKIKKDGKLDWKVITAKLDD